MPIADIRVALGASENFWSSLHRCLDAIGFTEEYVRGMRQVSASERPKYIKDSIWGMMEFRPDELAIIDSPLLQRLRRIRQLGLTYLTYPSAEHTRFIHTLGVTHVVKRLIASIAEVSSRDNSLQAGGQTYLYFDPSKDKEIMRCLSHAALLHDAGHLAFSHASEAAFLACTDTVLVGGLEMEEFLQIFRDASFDSKLSECLSISICLSPRFHAFYVKIIGEFEAERWINAVCSLIGGVPHEQSYPGLANIISGDAVDADKIDYISRDARECGIPVGVDVSRVFLNSALVHVSEIQAAALSRSTETVSGKRRFVSGWHFIVNSTGIDTYDELANAKAVLYHRVYLHQLTRNAEQVLAAAIRSAVTSPADIVETPPRDVFSWFKFGDDELLANLAHGELTGPAAERLLLRRLPKRAFVLFHDVCEPFVTLRDIFDPQEWPSSSSESRLSEMEISIARQTAWKLLDQIVPADPDESPRRVEELRTQVRNEAVGARSALEPNFDPARLRANEPFVSFAPRVTLKPTSEVLVREKNSIGYSSHWTKSEELAAAQGLGRSMDYFYCDREWRVYVAIACMKVLYDFHTEGLEGTIQDKGEFNQDYEGVSFDLLPRLHLRIEDICSRVGLPYAELLQCMAKAAPTGYFGGAERIVPLESDLLRRCSSIAEIYRHFLGERGWRVTERSIATFTRQFPVSLRREILDILAGGEVIGRSRMRRALDQIVRQLSPGDAVPLIVCRFSPNSGNFTGMILEQERRDEYETKGHIFVRSLSELEIELARERKRAPCVVFVDDQFATGGQAEAQLRQWSGMSRDLWPERLQGEQNIEVSALRPSTRRHFEKGSIALAFVFGTDAGKARIENVARELGFDGLQASFHNSLPSRRPHMSEPMRRFLTEVGTELLKRVRYGNAVVTPEHMAALRSDALGYGGEASVIMTLFNAPSHAITALWCPGVFAGQPWLPLFLRRGYRKHLVLG